jgi:VCBS repeat-containing protein
MTDSVVVQLGDGVTCPLVTITITQTGDGKFHFDVAQSGSVVGDLRGVFFDVGNESTVCGSGTQAQICGAVSATGTGVTNLAAAVVDGNDTVTSAGDKANNMNGALSFDGTGGEAKGYDVGIGFGSEGIGKDDVRNVSFDLKIPGLTLDDLVGMDFGVRLMSVGTEGGTRDGSCKLTSLSFTPYDDPSENIHCVLENHEATDNILQVPPAQPGGVTVSQTLTSFTLGDTTYTFDATHTSFTVDLPNTEGAEITIASDGTYTIVSGGDPLGADEHIPFDVTYTVHQVYTDSAGHVIGQLDNTSTLDFDICGENDDPEANNDAPACVVESTASVSGNVITGAGNEFPGGGDSDIDRTDTLSVGTVNGQALGDDGVVEITLANGAKLTMNSDGSYTFETNHAYDSLNDGQMKEEVFTYTVDDGHGGTDTATLTICIDGEGGGPGPGGDPTPPSTLGLSHGYWKEHDGSGPQANDWGTTSSPLPTTTSFESIFGDHGSWDIDSPFDTDGAPYTKGPVVADITLAEALVLGGGGQNELAREAVGAYLNAIDEDNVDNGGSQYNYQYTAAEVVAMVQDAFDGSGGLSMDQVTALFKASHD